VEEGERMSDKHLARRAETQVVLNGVDISVYVNKDWLSFTYTDNEEDEADDLQIKVCDRDGKWLRKWLNSIIDGGALGGSVISTAPEGSTKTSTSSGSSSSASGGTDKPRYRVTASTGVNIRKGAGEKYKVIGKLPYGTIVEVNGFYSSWAKITYSGKTGYIKGTNLKSVGGGGSSSYSGPSSSTKSSSTTKSGSTANTQVQTGKGLKISAVIVLRNGNNDGKDAVLDCGQFELDSIDAQGPPATVTIKATSLSFSNTVRQTLKSKSWENITLSEIASQIARQNGMGVLFESGFNPRYSRVEQYQTSDIAFLQKLCHNAGCSLKATNNILVVFDQAAYEGKKAVRKIKFGEEGGYTKYKLSTGTNNCYTSCRVYCTTTSGAVISATEYAQNYNENSDNQQCLQVCQRVSSKAEAQELAHKLLRLHNKFEITGTFTFPGDPRLAAGNTVELCDFGFGDGKYIVKSAKHSISSSGYTTQVTLRKCLSESESTSGGKTDSSDEIQELAMQVIRGEWDVYPKRKELLEAAGHSYEQVQARVNQILYGG
jgi:phage protein D/SH3-like domain-containing protein